MNDTAMEMEVTKSYMSHKQVYFCGFLIAFTCLNSRDAAGKRDITWHSQKGCEMPLTLEVMCQPLIHKCCWELIASFSEYTDLQVRKKGWHFSPLLLCLFWVIWKFKISFRLLSLRRTPKCHRAGKRWGHISVAGVMDCVSQFIDSWGFHRMKWFKLVKLKHESKYPWARYQTLNADIGPCDELMTH